MVGLPLGRAAVSETYTVWEQHAEGRYKHGRETARGPVRKAEL